LVRHPQKTLWLLHQYRQAYDMFDAGQTNLPRGAEGEDLRRLIKGADNETFKESRKIFTNSHVTQARLKKYNEFEAEVLLPPVNDPEIFTGGTPGGYIFAGGRVNGMKRQRMLLKAMAMTDPSVKLIIAGPPETDGDRAELHGIVESEGLEDRVKLDLRFLPRQVYADYINNAQAVAYIPFDEDSLGYVAMEAATASKALITTDDSGGILGLVKPGTTGWVAAPDEGSLAEAMNAVFTDATRTRDYGRAARTLWDRLEISWLHTVEKLLQ
jgi:glycosyltransferase involved in cell wall biosynthesis